MFRLIQTHKPGGDECAPYDVKFDKPYTIGELVKEVLTERSNEWGEFEVREGGGWFKPTIFRVEYKYGKLLGDLPDEVANLAIESANSYGGWSNMDYNIIVKQ